jgi:DNA mismatch repair ATPase MutS
MKTLVKNNNLPVYTYKLENGISNIKGGVSVLTNLNYPTNIINTTKKVLSNL